MVLKDYLSISGQHGLFRFIAQGRNLMIVENLETKKRTSAFATSKVSSLEDISVFTQGEDVPLAKVFDKIYEKENGGPCPDEKSDITVLKNYFVEILPEYDRERVYDSDIRKIFRWYNILQKLNLLVKEEPEKETESKAEEKTEEVNREQNEENTTPTPEGKSKKAESVPAGEKKTKNSPKSKKTKEQDNKEAK